jgi:single-strand DNA-binding protein
MAAGDTQITIAGNLVDDPELRFTPAGQPVAKFRIASTPRFMDRTTNEWKDGDSLFLTCNVWRQAAENVAESLTRGMRVIVSGRLRQRSYETKEGEKRTVYEVEVDDVGPSLRNASAKVNRVARSGSGSGDGSGFGGGQRGSAGQGGGGQGGSGQGGSGQGGSGQGGSGQGGSGQGGSGQGGGRPAASSVGQGGSSGGDTDPWATDGPGGYSDEPPF